MRWFRPPHPNPLPPKRVERGEDLVAGFFMMAEPQIGPVFSPLPNGGEGQGEGEVVFPELRNTVPYL